MPRIGPISRREFIQHLRTLGFEGPYQEGRHPFMVRGTLRLTIPNPHASDIGTGLLARLLHQAGVSKHEWQSL